MLIHILSNREHLIGAYWAVVLFGEKEQSASTQKVLTTCRLYEQYTTDEALQRAAESYGNVKQADYLSPNTHERKHD